ncbi:MAG: response regulator [Pyrinomonadaceae bacterium]|nr:response regulator [Sphingobacteriaceae bacterium]
MDFPKVAIEYVRESIVSGKNTPSVIFLDLRMPDMSGFEFLKALENIPELKPDQIKIYILSSSLDPGDMKRVKENRLVSKFIGKPLTSQALAEI